LWLKDVTEEKKVGEMIQFSICGIVYNELCAGGTGNRAFFHIPSPSAAQQNRRVRWIELGVSYTLNSLNYHGKYIT
jgi:hypothetical protein